MLRDIPPLRVVVAVAPGDLGVEQRINLRLTLETAALLARSGIDLVVGIPSGSGLPAEVKLPSDVVDTSYSGARRAWLKATARPGDLILLPAAAGPWVIGFDAASSTRLPDVSVAVVVGAFGAGTIGSATTTGTAGLAAVAEAG
jgi:hypothetical protein